MIKKWFFDYWDNFFHFLIINLIFVISLLIPFGLPAWILSFSPLLSVIVLIMGLLWLGIFSSAAALYINEIAQCRSPEPKQFFSLLKKGAPHGMFCVGILTLAVFLVYVVIPFYSSFQNFVGIAAMTFLFWTVVIFILAMQYYFPIVAQLDKRPGKILRKIFIILFDNLAFSILLWIFSGIIFLLSGLTAFLLFGPSGILLLGQVALKLRLYKYDYLEENPGVNRKKIPWQVLINEDRQRVGSRSFRNFIFPWKD